MELPGALQEGGFLFCKSEQRLEAGLDLPQATDGRWGLLESRATSELPPLSALRAPLKERGWIAAKPPGAWHRKGPEPRAWAGGKRAAEPGREPGAWVVVGKKKKSIFNY